MSVRLALTPELRQSLNSWTLPDEVLVEVLLRLQKLRDEPAQLLLRTAEPFNGMVYYFEHIDPANRLHEYRFAFHVCYSQDEETLIILEGVCLRHFAGD